MDSLITPAVNEALSLKADGDVGALKVFVLHHQLKGWSEETPFELVNVVAEFIVVLGEFGDIGSVDAQLRLANYHIAVPKVDEQIAVVGFEAVLHSQHFELLSTFGDLCAFHFAEEFDYLFCGRPFDLAAQQIVDVEEELLSFGLIFEVVLGDLNQLTNDINNYFVGGLLDGAFEEEVVGDPRLRLDELEEGFTLQQFREEFEEIFGPFYEDSSDCTGIKFGSCILHSKVDLGTGEDVVSENIFHVFFEGILQFEGFVEEEADVIIDCLDIYVIGVTETFGFEVIEKIFLCFSAGNIGKLNLLCLSSLRVAILQLLKNVKKSIIGCLRKFI